MNLTVVAVGKLKERFWTDAVAEYARRLSGYVQLDMREVPDRSAVREGRARALERESQDILSALPSGARVVLLDRQGRQYSSEELAAHLDDLKLSGTSSFAFVVGGSYGVAPVVRARADECISFGKLTLPHNLARVVLLEQLYRCIRISRGEPYHK
jgi:23S rRNA (pseudouridine1915-N3)-methyltransferase